MRKNNTKTLTPFLSVLGTEKEREREKGRERKKEERERKIHRIPRQYDGAIGIVEQRCSKKEGQDHPEIVPCLTIKNSMKFPFSLLHDYYLVSGGL